MCFQYAKTEDGVQKIHYLFPLVYFIIGFEITSRILRMLDDDMGVALFSLDQVWDGKGNYLLNTDSQSLHNYLPIGSTVKVMVR